MGACMVVGDFLVRFLVRFLVGFYLEEKVEHPIRYNGPKEIAARLAVPVGLLSIEFADV